MACRHLRVLFTRCTIPALVVLFVLGLPLPGSAPSALEVSLEVPPPVKAPPRDAKKSDLSVQEFLDRLMIAESGGRLDAKNPRSTALGPFQFVRSTFLEVVRRHFPEEVAGLSDQEILALRVNPDFARRVALAYTLDNASFLGSQGLDVTSVNLRLAFLVGPTGAMRVLTADADTPVSALLSAEALAANPFMASMTAGDLVRKAALDLSGNGRIAGLEQSKSAVSFRIPCNLGRASCRRWVTLRKKKLARLQTSAAEAPPTQLSQQSNDH